MVKHSRLEWRETSLVGAMGIPREASALTRPTPATVLSSQIARAAEAKAAFGCFSSLLDVLDVLDVLELSADRTMMEPPLSVLTRC